MTRSLLRNAAIGAALLSYRALFTGAFRLLPLLAGFGALAGIVYTLLSPLFPKQGVFTYVPWVLSGYACVFGLMFVELSRNDEFARDILTSPWGIVLLLVSVGLGSILAARTFGNR